MEAEKQIAGGLFHVAAWRRGVCAWLARLVVRLRDMHGGRDVVSSVVRAISCPQLTTLCSLWSCTNMEISGLIVWVSNLSLSP